MLSHKEKSVKTLVDERLEGKKYIRVHQQKPAINLSQISLQLIAPINPVLKSFLDEKTDIDCDERSIETREEVMSNIPAEPVVSSAKSVAKKKFNGYSLPTQLQKLGGPASPSKAEPKAQSFKGLDEVEKHQESKEANQIVFTRMPKTLANLVR